MGGDCRTAAHRRSTLGPRRARHLAGKQSALRSTALTPPPPAAAAQVTDLPGGVTRTFMSSAHRRAVAVVRACAMHAAVWGLVARAAEGPLGAALPCRPAVLQGHAAACLRALPAPPTRPAPRPAPPAPKVDGRGGHDHLGGQRGQPARARRGQGCGGERARGWGAVRARRLRPGSGAAGRHDLTRRCTHPWPARHRRRGRTHPVCGVPLRHGGGWWKVRRSHGHSGRHLRGEGAGVERERPAAPLSFQLPSCVLRPSHVSCSQHTQAVHAPAQPLPSRLPTSPPRARRPRCARAC